MEVYLSKPQFFKMRELEEWYGFLNCILKSSSFPEGFRATGWWGRTLFARPSHFHQLIFKLSYLFAYVWWVTSLI